MGRVSDPTDEFSFLPAQAADIGIDGPLPRGERLSLPLPDGRVLSALRYGGEAPQVTFLHGAGLNAHTWDTTILALGLPALAIDLPGHGDSSWRADAAYTGGTLAPDVAVGIEAWSDRPQLLVGQSLGGLTAAAVAASRPDLVREVVVVDITPGLDPNGGAAQLRQFFAGPTDWTSRDELVERALAFGLGGSRAAAERGVYHNSRIRPDGRVEWKHHFAHLANAMAASPELADAAAAQQDALAAVLSESGWTDLAAIRAPLTLVRGTRGYLTDADTRAFRERVPAASVVEFDSGHNVQEERPLELGRFVAERAGKG
ncbi:alpha/beta hydrolase [Microbacterium sp. BK668]|uniref:alpha/beta fold hydrolase n=1 Tax=Microbacterium sp. BK668 TaxID=2512118 RepID=UPI00105FBD70|nr:alpha/beta hydrolase [Microbacterium sp. BK668]TDN88485.1 pimeloyl-ACP methyl ester carboxylesterase [Microbacterium sp. BK668]